jgi:hypothetical protein
MLTHRKGSREEDPLPRQHYRAIAFTAASVILTLFCPEILGPHFIYRYTCLGTVLLAVSRFYRIKHGVPCPEAVFLGSLLATGWVFRAILPSATIPSLDQILWNTSSAFGYREIALVSFFLRHPLANAIMRLAYTGIPTALVLAYLALPNSTEIRRKYCIASGMVNLIVLCYRVCPAAGPLYLFGPKVPWAAHPIPQPHFVILPGVQLNCVPSGHTAWAIIMFYFAWRYCGPVAKIWMFIFLFLTCCGTLGLGEHYVVDLVVAVPFSLILIAVTEQRWRQAAICFVPLLAWLITLRYGWVLAIPTPLMWILCAVTIATPWWSALEFRFAPADRPRKTRACPTSLGTPFDRHQSRPCTACPREQEFPCSYGRVRRWRVHFCRYVRATP